MPIPEPITWTITALARGWEYREQISGVFAKTKELLRLGKRGVAITGLSGAGKSTLIDDFEGRTSIPGYHPPGQSLDTDTGHSGDHLKRRVRFLAVPGLNAPSRIASVNEVFYDDSKPLAGVIHVVSNGYPYLRDPVANEQRVASGIDTIAKLRRETLDLEVGDINEVARWTRDHYGKHRRQMFFSVVVNKFDLYTDDADSVRKHYHPNGGSEFSVKLLELHSNIGRDNIHLTSDPIAAWPEDFRDCPVSRIMRPHGR